MQTHINKAFAAAATNLEKSVPYSFTYQLKVHTEDRRTAERTAHMRKHQENGPPISVLNI